MKKIISLFIGIFLTVNMVQAGNDPRIVGTELKSATIYRSGAELNHFAGVQLIQGHNDLMLGNMSNTLDINSVQVSCPAGVTILAVEFTTDHLTVPEVSARIKYLTDSIEAVDKNLEQIKLRKGIAEDLLEVLRSNKDIKGQQGLTVAELAKLMEYYEKKIVGIKNDLLSLQTQEQKWGKIKSQLQAQVHEEEKKNARTTGRLHITVHSAMAGNFDFNVSYITPNAYWTPTYDVRVDDIKKPMKLIYKAKMVQTTGMDWKKVKLSLSSSLPNQWGNAPVLQSWFLGYINPVAVMDRRLMSNRIQGYSSESNTMGVPGAVSDIKIRGAASLSDYNIPLYVVNGTPMSADEFAKIDPSTIKSVDILKDAAATSLYGTRGNNGVVLVTLKDGLEDYVTVSNNELNVSFDIDMPFDIPSNGKEQTATLTQYELATFYKYYSVPRLDKDSYLLAEVADWEKLNLMPGEANIIFEGTYVGKSFIDPNSTQDTLNLTLGRDKRVVVKKEKLADFSSVKFLGSNKLQKITYELTVKNNKKDTVRMMLKDQYPLSTLKDIEVELEEDGGAMNNKDVGVLTWKLELAPGESRKIRFAYSVKYPKDRQINLN
ncbi:MAG: DUF4139 domain-containing protein [Chitinophagaceae bacterium]|nr:DUF4139 domain-containing protein [Chitinophagaceae bacterium]